MLSSAAGQQACGSNAQGALLSASPFHEEAPWPAIDASAVMAEELLGVGDVLSDLLDGWGAIPALGFGASPTGVQGGVAPAPAPAPQRCLDATHTADCIRRAPHGCGASPAGTPP